ncbi:ABC transporter protein [Rhizoctonia solani AG-1 IA]|uniref:ABC transporter protein n=1 Tax=Thanatephorus cucumeris (strain AG1-IA) TaxID=983506 RepID=L8X4Q8_THACA|nr:ABC transporter protein [Rhizoctonia solani AG-1 IA]
MAGETSADALPPPPMYDLVVDGYTIAIPPPRSVLPLPGFLRPKSSESEHGTIIRDVSLRCESGEMMAMQVVCLLLPYLELIYSLTELVGRVVERQHCYMRWLVDWQTCLSLRVKYEPAGISLSAKESVALSARKMKDRIGFVRQHDYLLEHLTVRETLDYAAALRLPSSISSSTRRLIVDQTIRELGLGDAADTVVGGALRKASNPPHPGISGGERRRLTIALSLISLPSILALDEPTTGLDAFTAYALLQTLSSLARKGRTVIMSVHQPRSDAWELFDRIVVLSKGDVVFAGRREKCLGWFEDMGMGSPGDRTEGCEDVAEKGSINVEADGGTGVNPLDWLIDICSVDPRDQGSIQRVTRLIQGWKDGGKVIADEHSPSRQSGILSDVIQRVPSVQPQEQDVLYANVQQNEDQPGSRPQALERPGWIRQTVVLTSRICLSKYWNCRFIGHHVLAFGRGANKEQTLSYQHAPCYFYLTLIYAIYKVGHEKQEISRVLTIFWPSFARRTWSYLIGSARIIFTCVVILIDRPSWTNQQLGRIASRPMAYFGVYIYFAAAYYFVRAIRRNSIFPNKHENRGPCGQFVYFYCRVRTCPAGNRWIRIVGCEFAEDICASKSHGEWAIDFLLADSNFVIGQFRSIMYVFARWFPLAPNPNSPQYGFRAVAISQFKNRTFACPGVEGAARNQVYKPGGTRYARKIDPSDAGKGPAVHSDMDISRQRIDVEVRNLGLKWIKTGLVTRKKTEKRILNDVHAVFPSGQVTAILGPSGAGKSTLLQLLASRRMNAGVGSRFESQGEILFNGRPVNKNTRDQVAFVEQEDDYHLPALTASFFSIVLHVPHCQRNTSLCSYPSAAKRHVSKIENRKSGGSYEDARVGLVSGNIWRRKEALEFGSSDEPTSGLDALTANNVMTALNDIARSGRTIILSIHQPRSDIYVDKLDNIILLVKGGEVAYAGPRSEVGPTLTSAGHPIPPLYNPADWLLDLASVDLRRDREEATRERVAKLVKRWANTHREMKELDLKDREEDLVQVGGPEERFTPMWIALPLIVDRMTKNLQVNSSPHSIHKTNVMQVETASRKWSIEVFWVRLQQLPFLGVLFLLFYQRLKHGPSGGQDRIGYFQEMVSPVAFVGLLNCIAIFPKDRDLYFHEYRSSAAYSEATFVLGFTLVALPMEILASLFKYLPVTKVNNFRLSDIAYATTMKYAARVIAVNESVGLKLHCSPETVQSGECLVQSGQELLDLLGFSNNLKTGRYLGILVALALAYRVLAWFFVVLKIRRGLPVQWDPLILYPSYLITAGFLLFL